MISAVSTPALPGTARQGKGARCKCTSCENHAGLLDHVSWNEKEPNATQNSFADSFSQPALHRRGLQSLYAITEFRRNRSYTANCRKASFCIPSHRRDRLHDRRYLGKSTDRGARQFLSVSLDRQRLFRVLRL